MYTQPLPAVKLDSTTNESYGRYQSNPYHQRLPQPPRVLKNRYIDQTRHRLRRSNDEYGHFLDQPEAEVAATVGDRNFPAGLTSDECNRHALSLNRGLTNRKGAESVAFWHEPWENPREDPPNDSPPLSDRRPERRHFDIETLHPLYPAPSIRAPTATYRDPPVRYREPLAPYREPPPAPYRVQPAPLPPIARNPPTMENGRSERRQEVDDLENFVERYKLHVGIENKGRGTSVQAPDIRFIDLRLHLKDNSSLTIKAVPFSFY